MLSHEELLELYQRLALPPKAQAVIQEVRSLPPSRRVRNAAGNVSVRYPSRKMGVTIQAESHRNELAGIYEKEHDRQTLEYYDQPPPIQLSYLAKSVLVNWILNIYGTGVCYRHDYTAYSLSPHHRRSTQVLV